MLRFVRILVPVALVLGLLFAWWIERDRARHVDRPESARSHVAAARMVLREIAVAQEVYAAEHDGRYAASLDTLLALNAEIAPLIERGVRAVVSADTAGAWYAAQVGHDALPGWRCRMAGEGSPDVLAGRLPAWEHACDPTPGDDVDSDDDRRD
ncbi:MAG TPA: hypothetical protein VF039_04980 [Longimicrobiales bacterium]